MLQSEWASKQEMYKDPRSTSYRKPRKFYGTPFNKYIYGAIFISSGFILTISYNLGIFLNLERVADKFRFLPNKTILESGQIEWTLEQKLRERINIKKEVAKQQQESKEVPT